MPFKEIAVRKTTPVVKIHAPPVIPPQLTLLILPQLCKIFPSPSQIGIRVFAIKMCKKHTVFLPLHPSLNLKRINTGICQLRYVHQGTGILCTEKISLTVGSPKLQTAGLGTHPPVSTSSSDHLTHQALAGITVTKSPVDKHFDLKICLPARLPYFFYGELPGRHIPGHSVWPQKLRLFPGKQCHLCTGMQIHIWEVLMQEFQYAHILHNAGIQSRLVQRQQHRVKFLLQLPVGKQGIYRQIYFLFSQMSVEQRLCQFFYRWVIRKSPRPKLFRSYINRVRPHPKRPIQALYGSGRRQNLNLSHYTLLSSSAGNSKRGIIRQSFDRLAIPRHMSLFSLF